MCPTVFIPDDIFARIQKFAIPIVDDISITLTKILDIAERSKETNSPGIPVQPPSRLRLPNGIPNRRFGRELLEAIRDRGPCGTDTVFDELEERLRSKLTSKDLSKEPTGQVRWRHAVHTTKAYYKRVGLIRDLERGVWSLTETSLKAMETWP